MSFSRPHLQTARRIRPPGDPIQLHTIRASQAAVNSSGDRMILRQNPRASGQFGKTTRRRPATASTVGQVKVKKTRPKTAQLSESVERLSRPKDYRDPVKLDTSTPWVPPGIANNIREDGAPLQTWSLRSSKAYTSDEGHGHATLASESSARRVFDDAPFGIGDRIGVQGYKVEAKIRWMGVFPGNGVPMVGVEFDAPVGRNNGNNWGYRLYKCKLNHGLFVRPDSVVYPIEPGAPYKVGDSCSIDGYDCNGIIRYMGMFPKGDPKGQEVVGIELDSPAGDHNGTVEDTRYFRCPPLHGLFADPGLVLYPANVNIGTGSSQPLNENAKMGDRGRDVARETPNEFTKGYLVGDRVGVVGFPCNGTVRFVGNPLGSDEKIVGIELDQACGNMGGIFKDVTYFRCQDNYGIVCPAEQIVFPAPEKFERRPSDDPWYDKHMKKRRSTVRLEGYRFSYDTERMFANENRPTLMSWHEFAQLPGHDLLPIKLVTLLYDHFLEESEQAWILEQAVKKVQSVRKQKGDASRVSAALEAEVDRAVGLRTLHHDELNLVADRLKFRGQIDDMRLSTGGVMDRRASIDEPRVRSPGSMATRDEEIVSRTLERQSSEVEHMSERLQVLKLKSSEKTELEQLIKLNPVQANDKLLALENSKEHWRNAHEFRLDGLKTKWSDLEAQQPAIAERLTPSPEKTHQSR